MAEENLRSRHAFGSIENLQQAIEAGKVDHFDILFLQDENDKPQVGWIDKNGDTMIVDTEKVIHVDALPESGEGGKIYIFNGDGYFWNGTEFINLCKPTDLTELEAEVEKKADAEEVKAEIEKSVNSANAYTDEKLEAALAEHLVKKYEIVSKPEGTLVDYRDKEIRVMCPADTKWVKQSVGETGNANMYYMGFRAYAPEGAVSFKEGDQGVIVDEMFDFTGDFAGTDEYGRNYSIVWLALAKYDESSDTWTYFGKNSSTSKYIGWTYVVEWFNANGVIIASDSVRINLSNESCHSNIEPYYMSNAIGSVDTKVEEAVNTANTYTDEQIAAVVDAMTIVEF